jgi:methionyl-tRNA synthetase
MAERDKFYITTAITYPNGVPHIGHAYEVIAADAIARFSASTLRRFLHDGTDEHGLKIQQTAQRNGTEPRPSSTNSHRNSGPWRNGWIAPFDRFIRTPTRTTCLQPGTLAPHGGEGRHLPVQVYGLVLGPDEAYFDESELSTARTARGAPRTERRWSGIEEESYFVRLAPTRPPARPLRGNPDYSAGTRRNEIVSLSASGLQDLSTSRTTFNWGLPVPGDRST